jgi:hypothetical protein
MLLEQGRSIELAIATISEATEPGSLSEPL